MNIGRTRIRLFPAVAVVIVLIALVIWQPWQGSLQPPVVLAKTYDAVAALQSYRMNVTGYSSSEPDGMTSGQRTEIEFVAPDRFHFVSTVEQNGIYEGEMEFIIIGDERYSRDGSAVGYTVASVPGTSSLLDREITLHYLDMMTDIETMPDEKVGGVDCIHYTGAWDIEKQIEEVRSSLTKGREEAGLPPMTDDELEKMARSLREVNIDIGLWIGKDDYLIRRITTDQRSPDGPDGSGTQTFQMTLEFSAINEPITIEAPLDENGNLLPGWKNMEDLPPPVPDVKYFSYSMVHIIGAQEGYDDPAHQELRFTLNIGNKTNETLTILRIFIVSQVPEPGQSTTIEVEPEAMGLSLGPGEGREFHAACPFDGSALTKEEIISLDKATVVLVDFITEDGQELSEMLHAGEAPYPTSTPPPEPAD